MTTLVRHAGAAISPAAITAGDAVARSKDWPGATGTLARKRSIPWWLWPNLLSLDAPAVACVWAVLLGRASGIKASPAVICVLCLTVWLIYSCDRVLDGQSLDATASGEIRHRFSHHHRTTILGSTVLLGFGTLWLAVKNLPLPLVQHGLGLAGCVGVYLLCVHAAPGKIPRLIPKELAVGGIFAAGTTLPIWSGSVHTTTLALACWTLFGALCALNCVAIECWERLPGDGVGKRCGVLVQWTNRRLDMLCGGVAAVSIGLWLGFMAREEATSLIAISTGALLTMALNLSRDRLSSHALRVLADVVLFAAAALLLAAPR